MGDDKIDPPRRGRLRRRLTRETRRLAQHASHLSVDEVRYLEGVTDELAQLHADDEECVNLARRHGVQAPPWGTKYVDAFERAILTVFHRRR